MQGVLELYEEYALENNLQFWTDPEPAKSKTKCIFMSGQMIEKKPVDLKLDGVDFPLVKTLADRGVHHGPGYKVS